MIIGSGMLANAFNSFKNDSNIIIFAKGVSNSQETKKTEFEREANLLKSALTEYANKTIVYFGTCSVDDNTSKTSEYVKHKIKMEKLIQASGLNYYIFRLPQVVGKTKSPTLINYLTTQIKNDLLFTVWKYSKRNLIDVEDVYRITAHLIKNNQLKNQIINIASNQSINIVEIVNKIEALLDKKAKYDVVKKGSSYDIDISKIQSYLKDIEINFNSSYIDDILFKYVIK